MRIQSVVSVEITTYRFDFYRISKGMFSRIQVLFDIFLSILGLRSVGTYFLLILPIPHWSSAFSAFSLSILTTPPNL
jgi:hypothetical protein